MELTLFKRENLVKMLKGENLSSWLACVTNVSVPNFHAAKKTKYAWNVLRRLVHGWLFCPGLAHNENLAYQ